MILGVEFDADSLSAFTDWNDRASIWCAHEGLCVVSANPTEVNWLEGELHNHGGPAVRFSDGYSAWSVSGVAVDEQIVMSGQTQTLEQLGGERNAEVKRIRIERFAGTNDPFDGWNRYRREAGAVEVDDRMNDSEGTYESLYSFPSGEKVLMPTCRTGRMFALEVPAEIETCAQAQDWFWNSGGHRWGKSNCIGRS